MWIFAKIFRQAGAELCQAQDKLELVIVKTQLNHNLNQIKVGLTRLWVFNPRNNRLRDT